MFSDEDIKWIYERTDGRCHLCRNGLAFRNYGTVGRRGSWEVDHSNPRARGGTDRRSNLLPACVSCNRSKQHGSTRQARAANGFRRRPMSRSEKEHARATNVALGGVGGAVMGAFIAGPVGALVVGLIGLTVGHNAEVE